MARHHTLLGEIERDLLDGKPLADVLRKCLLLGGKAGSEELRTWARHELRGYEGDELPPYRVISAVIRADAIVGNYSVTGQVLPETALPDFVLEAGLGNSVKIRQGVGELEALVASHDSGESIKMLFPGADIIGRLIDDGSGNPYQNIHNIYWAVARSAFQGLLDNVRTTLAELITELVAGLQPGQEMPTAEQANSAVNVAVHGGKSTITITASQASGHATSTIQPSPAGLGGDEPGWWTFGRKVWAVIVSIVVVAGGIAAVVALYR